MKCVEMDETVQNLLFKKVLSRVSLGPGIISIVYTPYPFLFAR